MAQAETVLCPALMLSGIASGQGKTTITAALARYHRNQGRDVRVFKFGPDYLDPQILSAASGQPVEQLDMWMGGEAYCRQKLYEAACEADLILIEGAMGLLDGEPSTADLAVTFGIPVAVVLNAKGMAQTTAALAYGIAHYRTDFQFHGLIANALGSQRHAELIEEAMPEDVKLLAALRRDEEVVLPERHLGLVQPGEQFDLDSRLEAGARWIAESPLTELPPAVAFSDQHIPAPAKLLEGKRIAIAKDEAFSFIYAANLRLLEAMGAQLEFFSPLADQPVPPSDAIWLPGGYPELHADKLGRCNRTQADLHRAFEANTPILAECGGMLFVQQTLTDLEGNCYPMTGLIPGHGAMRGRRGCQGMQSAMLPEGEVRAHAHHRSRSHDTLEPISHGKRQRHPAPGEAIYRSRALTASYLHLFFPANPEAIAQLLSDPKQF